MRIRLQRTGDPWMDIGIVSFHQDLEQVQYGQPELVGDLVLTPGYIEFRVDEEKMDALRRELELRMVQKLNRILLPPIELKLLDDSEWKSRTDERGFYDEKYKKTLSPQEIEQLKAGRTVRGKEFKPLSQPQKNVEMTSMRNYIGLKADWRRMAESYAQEIRDFFVQWQDRGNGKKKACPLCGREADPKSFRPMNQSRNVLFNQHHAAAVRGYAANVTKENMCPTCNLLNLYATVQVDWHPYFVSGDQVTHLLVPIVSDLEALREMMSELSGRLKELHESGDVTSYRTNIENLWHRTLYPALLTLYFWMGHVQEDAELRADPLSERTWRSVRGWLIPRYTRGQNVIFKEFSRVDTDESLFRLTQRAPYGTDRTDGDVVNDFMRKMKSVDPWLIDRIARGIVEKDLRALATGLFQLYKLAVRDDRGNGLTSRGCVFFRDYLTHFTAFLDPEVVSVLSEQLQTSLRSLGRMIGQTDDVSVLTKINAAPTCEAFVKALKDALFKVYKEADRQRKDGAESEDVYNIGTGKMHEILTQLNEKNLSVIRDTLSIYASLAAIQAHNAKKRTKERVEA